MKAPFALDQRLLVKHEARTVVVLVAGELGADE